MAKTIIIIPSRLAATRLPNKPLLKINNKSIINLVFQKAESAGIGDVYVATGDKEIFKEVEKNGGKCILTKMSHKTGTDRIYEALTKINSKDIEYVINLQGDEPMIDVDDIKYLNNCAISNKSLMATLACKIKEDKLFKKKNIVKVITDGEVSSSKNSVAKKFQRIILDKKKNYIYHHIGVYIYKASVLKKIVNLKQTKNEMTQSLEQLRAIENDIKIDVIYANSSPIGVDTKDDYMEIKKLMEYKT